MYLLLIVYRTLQNSSKTMNSRIWSLGKLGCRGYIVFYRDTIFSYCLHTRCQVDVRVFGRTAPSQRRQCHREVQCWNFCAKGWREKQCPLKRRGRDTAGISVPRVGRESSGQSLIIVLLIKLSFHLHRRTDIKLECESQGMWSWWIF